MSNCHRPIFLFLLLLLLHFPGTWDVSDCRQSAETSTATYSQIKATQMFKFREGWLKKTHKHCFGLIANLWPIIMHSARINYLPIIPELPSKLPIHPFWFLTLNCFAYPFENSHAQGFCALDCSPSPHLGCLSPPHHDLTYLLLFIYLPPPFVSLTASSFGVWKQIQNMLMKNLSFCMLNLVP